MSYQEINFDGLVGQTHNYAGLSFGNIASERHRNIESNPRAAAMQGLMKMKLLADRGFPQAVLPPQHRPDLSFLRSLGFSGSAEAVIRQAHETAPHLLRSATSASAMWTANAATVCPSCDSGDGRLHLTPANLAANLHRSIEAEQTYRTLGALFSNTELFAVHRPLPSSMATMDEGAANHTRHAPSFGAKGMHVFVYGQSDSAARSRYPSRQRLDASQALARVAGLDHSQAFFWPQSTEAIDAGVFHNDVIAVGHLNFLLYHEQAFADGSVPVKRFAEQFERIYGQPFLTRCIRADEVSLEKAVSAYLFNSQLLLKPDGTQLLLAPTECEVDPDVSTFLEKLTQEPNNPLSEVLYINLRQSMRNGGGPACLRQRIVLNEDERNAVKARIWMDGALYHDLTQWVEAHYRESLSPDELADPALLEESCRALDELSQLLRLGSIYPFQR